MFAAAGHSIAINGSSEARCAARVSIETDDLREVIPLLLR
jgi:phosphoserine phosphatase